MFQEERSSVVLQNQGQKIFGMLHLPLGLESVPAVLICHGFGGNKIGSNRLFVLISEALTKLGIAVFRLDYRGAGDSEGDFKETTIQGQLSDIFCGLKFLEEVPQIDAHRLGILGASLGGALSILAAKQFERVSSIVLWAPVASSFQWESNAHSLKDTKGDYLEYNGKLVTKRFYEEFFTMNVKKALESLMHVPLLHFHGVKDEIVIAKHQEYYSQWRKGGVKNKFVTLPNSDHIFSDRNDQATMLIETAKWFQETL